MYLFSLILSLSVLLPHCRQSGSHFSQSTPSKKLYKVVVNTQESPRRMNFQLCQLPNYSNCLALAGGKHFTPLEIQLLVEYNRNGEEEIIWNNFLKAMIFAGFVELSNFRKLSETSKVFRHLEDVNRVAGGVGLVLFTAETFFQIHQQFTVRQPAMAHIEQLFGDQTTKSLLDGNTLTLTKMIERFPIQLEKIYAKKRRSSFSKGLDSTDSLFSTLKYHL